MLADLKREMDAIETAPLLSWIDGDGYPATARVGLSVDEAAGVVRLDVPDGVTVVAGPASLWKHFHNERLWKIRNVLFRGKLRPGSEGGSWVFEPTKKFGSANPKVSDMFGMMRGAARTAKRYAARRNLGPLTVDHAAIKALKKEARKLGMD